MFHRMHEFTYISINIPISDALVISLIFLDTFSQRYFLVNKYVRKHFIYICQKHNKSNFSRMQLHQLFISRTIRAHQIINERRTRRTRRIQKQKYAFYAFKKYAFSLSAKNLFYLQNMLHSNFGVYCRNGQIINMLNK